MMNEIFFRATAHTLYYGFSQNINSDIFCHISEILQNTRRFKDKIMHLFFIFMETNKK